MPGSMTDGDPVALFAGRDRMRECFLAGYLVGMRAEKCYEPNTEFDLWWKEQLTSPPVSPERERAHGDTRLQDFQRGYETGVRAAMRVVQDMGSSCAIPYPYHVDMQNRIRSELLNKGKADG